MRSRHGGFVAVLAVTATYLHFLLFAQFGFLDLLQGRLAGAAAIRQAMALMGLAGLAGGFAAARGLARRAATGFVAAALALAGLAAPVALACHGGALLLASTVIGATTGALAVSLAAALPALLAGSRAGLAVGAGTGLAYLGANLPPLFAGSVAVRALVPAIVCLAAAAAVLARRAPGDVAAGGPFVPTGALALSARGAAGATLAFFALVALDSTAFAVVQATPALQSSTWGSGARTLAQGLVHLAAALLAGWLADRGRLTALLPAAFAALTVAFALLGGSGTGALARLSGPTYAIGISLYSVALVLYAAAPAARQGDLPPRWRAAVVFGVAGWLGSGAGVGAAQELHSIPPGLVAAAGALLALGLLVGTRRTLPLRIAAPPLVVAALLAPWMARGASVPVPGALPRGGSAVAPASLARLGREVYVAEGCIHCHSQYVRPGTHDEAWWGPIRALDRSERPPLIGTRRQGPDLANAGNRRSAAWHRLHLLAPTAVSPGSRMPSYAALFGAGDPRGPALVAYLTSLGAGTESERWAAIARARRASPAGKAGAGVRARGAALFAAYCARCHGPAGAGDGPLAATLARPTLDLRQGAREAAELPRLARVVRFGIPGSSMPGHEYLGDEAVRALAEHVASLAAASGEGG